MHRTNSASRENELKSLAMLGIKTVTRFVLFEVIAWIGQERQTGLWLSLQTSPKI